MKNLIMFSSFHNNPVISNRLLEMTGKKSPKVGVIPSSTRFCEISNMRTTKVYNSMGINNLMLFDLGYTYDETFKEDLFDCDIIHLEGGNTFLFLWLMRHRNMIEPIRRFVDNGGVLVGESAGSILMCKSIIIANFADENFCHIKDFSGLGLVNFQLKPHWEAWEEYITEFETFSIAVKKDIYLLKEKQIIIVEGKEITLVGDIKKINNGILI